MLGRGLPAAGVALLSFAAVVFVAGHVVGASKGSGDPSTVNGTPSKETIFGTQGDDLIRGRGGADKLVGRNGSDRIFGGRGHDKLRGGRGDDRLIAGKAGATMIGGRGEDQFNMVDGERVGGQGRDEIHARDGAEDEINCGPGGRDVAYVDGHEAGVYDCEQVIGPAAGVNNP